MAFDPDETCALMREALLTARTRRELVAALGKTAAGSALLGLFAGMRPGLAQAQPQPVTLFVFGGAWRRSLVEAAGNPFTQQTGVPVRYQEPYNWAKLRAMHEAKAQQIDCVSVQGTEVILAHRMNMTTPLDWRVIDRSALDPRQLTRPNAIGCYSLSMVVCYNTKTWPGTQHPNSWADFWNVEKFPGRRALRRDATWTVEAALLADGVKESEFYPLDVDRAFKSLDRIKPHVKVWWKDNSQAQALVEQQEVDLVAMMDGRATDTIVGNNVPYEVVWNQQISSAGGQGWIVPTGCPNPEGGMRFLSVLARPETWATFARLLYYAPLNPKAYDFIDPALAKRLSSYPDNEKTAHLVNYEWWADNLAVVQRRFERWLQS